MTHYVCTGGCGGTSPEPKSCGMESCSMYQKPMVECSCEDGKHEAVLSQAAAQAAPKETA